MANTSTRKGNVDAPAERTERPVPAAPSFGMCEGVRADLEQSGKTTDPFTGKVLTAETAT